MNFDVAIEASESTHLQIERQLRACIHRGEMQPGERLPSTREMARQWKMSCNTVQHALARLAADGLVERRPRAGTFVRASTDRAIIGILMASSLADETAHFYRTVLSALQTEMGNKSWACRVYDGLRPEEMTEYGKEQRRHLAQDLRNYTFKGLVEFGIQTVVLPEIPFDSDLPKVCLLHDKKRSDVLLDEYGFGRDAAAYVARAGRGKILYLRNSTARNSDDLDGLLDAVRKHRLPQPYVETLVAVQGHDLEQEAFRKVRSLFGNWRREAGGAHVPDALIVADDIAMRGAALALAHEQVSVPGTLLVLTHANEGIKLHYGIPVVRHEFSPKEMAHQALDVLWKRMTGDAMPPLPISLKGRVADGEVGGNLDEDRDQRNGEGKQEEQA